MFSFIFYIIYKYLLNSFFNKQISAVCEEILSLMVKTIQVLRVQLGASRVEATIQTFLEVFTTRHHLQLAVTTNEPAAVRVVDK